MTATAPPALSAFWTFVARVVAAASIVLSLTIVVCAIWTDYVSTDLHHQCIDQSPGPPPDWRFYLVATPLLMLPSMPFLLILWGQVTALRRPARRSALVFDTIVLLLLALYCAYIYVGGWAEIGVDACDDDSRVFSDLIALFVNFVIFLPLALISLRVIRGKLTLTGSPR